MVDLNRAYQEQLQKGLGTYTGPKTKGQAIGEGIAGLSMGADDFVLSLPEKITGGVQRMGESVLDYFNSPTAAFAEQTGKEQNLADARREASLTMPSDGLGRPREIQEQIDIFQALNPDAGSVTTEQINKLSEGKNLKPFPAQPKKQGLKPFPKEQAEQNVADANREASLDMPSMSDDPAEQLFSQAMTEYISQAREGAEGQLPKVGDIEAYKKKFAEATGVDISGKPDTSQALMAMGLSMMQNRAGKGFDVGKTLDAVGKAGEKALPALTAAKAEAKANQVAAGKYALNMESKDETKREAAKKEMSALGQYFILPKGDGVAGSVSSIINNKGSYETISKGELQQLMKNPEFASKYDVLPGAMYKDIIKEAMATPEAAKNWLTKSPSKRQLIAGIDDPIFNIEVFNGDPNGPKAGQTLISDQGQVQNAYRAFAAMDRDNERLRKKFEDAGYLVAGGAVDIASAIVDNTDSFISSFGINFREGATEREKLDYILTDLQAGNASRILGESGKTISDGDRKLVNEIVGNLDLYENKDQLAMKLNKLFTSIYTTANNQVLDGLANLDAISGQNVAGYLNSDKPLTKEEQEELSGFLGGSIAAPRYKTDTPSLGRG